MANIEGNRIALEYVLHKMLPSYDERLVQEPVGTTRGPWHAQYFAAGTTGWQRVECAGYELLVLAGDEVQQQGGTPAYLRFGTSGPPSVTGTAGTEGAFPVLPGTRIKIPQGFSECWFLPASDVAWRLVVVRVPHVDISYGPYAQKAPPMSVISTDQIASMPVAAPSLPTDGIVVPSRARVCAVQLFDFQAGPIFSRLAESIDVEVWWYTETPAGAGVPLWAHNPTDDWDAGGRTAASGAHDIERYAVEGVNRLYLQRTSPLGVTNQFDACIYFYG